MSPALKVALGLFVAFGSTALVLSALGVSVSDQLPGWLDAARGQPAWVAAVVIVALAVDSLLAVPTVATVVLTGHLLGPALGGLVASVGILAAGSICYWTARAFGESRFAPTETLTSVRATVGQVGPAPLLFARAAPMLPELLSVMAGAAGMRPSRYYLYFALGNVPFAFVAAWAGSVSTLDRPWPALAAGVAVPALGGVLLLARRRRPRSSAAR